LTKIHMFESRNALWKLKNDVLRWQLV